MIPEKNNKHVGPHLWECSNEKSYSFRRDPDLVARVVIYNYITSSFSETNHHQHLGFGKTPAAELDSCFRFFLCVACLVVFFFVWVCLYQERLSLACEKAPTEDEAGTWFHGVETPPKPPPKKISEDELKRLGHQITAHKMKKMKYMVSS